MIELNLKTKAAVQSTLTYNSMCKFGDVYLGATSAGIGRICGYSDNGVEIPAVVATGMFDLKTERNKRFAYVYLGLETNGAMEIELWCDGVYKVTLSVPYPGSGKREIYAKVPRGLRARYWQLRIKNVDGSFFVLYSVKLLPVVLQSAK